MSRTLIIHYIELLLYYAVTHCEGPTSSYNFWAAASCTASGALPAGWPWYWAGATESHVLCKNWNLPEAPDDGFVAWISPPDSRCAICCKCAFTPDEPSEASFELDSFELAEDWVAVSCCGCWADSCCGALCWVDCCACEDCSLGACSVCAPCSLCCPLLSVFCADELVEPSPDPSP